MRWGGAEGLIGPMPAAEPGGRVWPLHTLAAGVASGLAFVTQLYDTGAYELWVEPVDGCHAYYDGTEMSGRREEAVPIEVSEMSVTDLVLLVPHDLCRGSPEDG